MATSFGVPISVPSALEPLSGFGTSWFGKNHNTPVFTASMAGPFDQWPVGMGFEYFYGFVGGDTSQWQPNLTRNTTTIYPYVGKPGWNLTTEIGRASWRETA